MTNNSNSIPDEAILAFLLDLKEHVKSKLNSIGFIQIIFKEEKFTISFNEDATVTKNDKIIAIYCNQNLELHSKSTIFQLDKDFYPALISNNWLDQKSLDLIILYLPICFYSLKAYQLQRSVSLLHYAQSLDGKIAANNGNSRWIGNQENLVHAHWLRALFDGILIGSNTLKIDKPRLNVRLVEGPNPIKIVIGTNLNEYESLLESNGKVLFISSKDSSEKENIENITIPCQGKCINPIDILTELYKRGIHSLFIEGGAFTGSSFISTNGIDFLQLFISPIILGSGIASFSLKEITKIDDSIEFTSQAFRPMGNGMLFTGVVKY